MPGFVDTSNMSDLEIKRLSQMDDDEPVTYRTKSYRKPYRTSVINTYNADDVWAASAQAFDTNGEYLKLSIISESDPSLNKKCNKQIVTELLADPTQITQESRDKGLLIRKYYQAYTFKILQGKQLNEFNNTAMTIANKDMISSNYDIAVITSLPASYEKATVRDSADRRINFARGGYVGNLDEKVTVTIEVAKNIYSQKWNTWYVTGITTDDKVLFFAYKGNLNIGDRVTIQGTVKSYRDNSTQLNRVKVIA